jgi:hypothetical protein
VTTVFHIGVGAKETDQHERLGETGEGGGMVPSYVIGLGPAYSTQ